MPNDLCQGTVLIHVDLDEGAHHPRQEEMNMIFVSPIRGSYFKSIGVGDHHGGGGIIWGRLCCIAGVTDVPGRIGDGLDSWMAPPPSPLTNKNHLEELQFALGILGPEPKMVLCKCD